MRRLLGFLVAAAAIAALSAGPAAGQTPPSLAFELSSNYSYVQCAAFGPGSVVTPDPTPNDNNQTCSITQPNGGTAWCIQKKSAKGPTPITQTCTITQTSTTHANYAYVIQIAEHRGGASPQDTSQTATVQQGNQFATNNSSVAQVARQRLGGPLDADGDYWGTWSFAADADQVQNVRQLADVCQGSTANCQIGAGMLSHNNSTLIQKQWQSEQAAATATIDQEQNTDAAPFCEALGHAANMCANVDQNTSVAGAGRNKEALNQLYVQLQNARGKGATVTDQRQGGADVLNGGLAHEVTQLGGGVATITTGQNSFQFQKAANVGALFQKQDPRISKGHSSTQSGAPGTSWTGRERAFQFQLEDGVLVTSVGGQRALLEYFAVTNGSIQVDQLVNQNGQTDTNSCSASPCAAILDCTNVEEGEITVLQAQSCVKDEPPYPD